MTATSEKDLYYYTIGQTARAEYKDKGSRFIAYAYPVKSEEAVKTALQALRKEHPKANHHCFAYRLGTDGNRFRASDAGEPSGSAGKPILGQIDSRGITDILVIVVRYFGGTLLGIPGLIKAYKTTAALALQLTPVIKKPLTISLRFDFDYTVMNEVMHWAKRFEAKITAQDIQLFCTIYCDLPKSRLQEAKMALRDLPAIEVTGL